VVPVLNGLKTIIDSLNVSLFGRGPDAAQDDGLQSQTAQAVPRPAPRDFDTRLAELHASKAAAGSALVAGSLEIVGLDDVRSAMGIRWPQVSAEILALAESEIDALLGADDFFRRHGEATFVLCFARLDVTQAKARAEAIADQLKQTISARYPDFTGSLRVEPFVAEIAEPDFSRPGAAGLVEGLRQSLAEMRREAEQAARRYRASLVNNFNLAFAPAIHARSRVTIYNRAILETSAGCTTLAQFQALADPEQITEALAELDYLALTKSLAALHKALKNRGGVIILVPVNYRTLAVRESQDEYARLLDMLPPAYKRLIGLEIIGLPQHAPREEVVEIVERLRPHVKWIAFEVPSLEGRSAILGIEGIWALSCNLSGANSVDPRLAQRLREFVGIAAASRLSTLAHGANSIGAALAACDAGFTCVDGPAIQASSDTPRIATTPGPQLRSAHAPMVRKW
jgi:GGDEF domain-containing protein